MYPKKLCYIAHPNLPDVPPDAFAAGLACWWRPCGVFPNSRGIKAASNPRCNAAFFCKSTIFLARWQHHFQVRVDELTEQLVYDESTLKFESVESRKYVVHALSWASRRQRRGPGSPAAGGSLALSPVTGHASCGPCKSDSDNSLEPFIMVIRVVSNHFEALQICPKYHTIN